MIGFNTHKQIVFVAGALLLYLFSPLNGSAQTCRVGEIGFNPLNPRPLATMNLEVSIDSAGSTRQQLTIKLIAQIDLNGDFIIRGAGETVRKTISVKDNDTSDMNKRVNEISVAVYTVPSERQPLKYIAIISCGTDSKSASIKPPPAQTQQRNCIPPNWFGDLLGVFCVPPNTATQLGIAGGAFRVRGPGGADGLRSIYIYSFSDKRLAQILQDNNYLFSLPNFSPDNENIVFVASKEGRRQIARFDIKGKKYELLTDGPDDSHPFWLPDGKSILFLRGNLLSVINVENKQVRTIGSNLVMDKIMGVSRKSDGSILIFYQAPNSEYPETKEPYTVELDAMLQPRDVTQLVNDSRFFLFKIVSPKGDIAVYSERDSLFIEKISSGEREKMFQDGFKYRDSAWSPDGTKIVFVSDRTN